MGIGIEQISLSSNARYLKIPHCGRSELALQNTACQIIEKRALKSKYRLPNIFCNHGNRRQKLLFICSHLKMGSFLQDRRQRTAATNSNLPLESKLFGTLRKIDLHYFLKYSTTVYLLISGLPQINA